MYSQIVTLSHIGLYKTVSFCKSFTHLYAILKAVVIVAKLKNRMFDTIFNKVKLVHFKFYATFESYSVALQTGNCTHLDAAHLTFEVQFSPPMVKKC